MKHFLVMMIVVILAAGWVVSGNQAPRGSSTSAAALPPCDPDNGGLKLPQGFCAVVVADNLGRARHIAVTPNGDFYVRIRGAQGSRQAAEQDPGGGIVALRDANGDGKAEVQQRFGNHYGTGMELHNGFLYVSTDLAVLRYRMTPGQLVPAGEPETIVGGFPEQRGHAAKAFALDDAGRLYVNVGAPSNTCQGQDRTQGALGQRPCPQLERQASVWRFSAERVGQTQEKDGHKFVTGTRNIVAIAWDPASRAMHALQHGRDQVGQWQGFDEEDNAELPSEEFFRLEDGANFGWPYCYHDRFQSRRILAPEYGGDGKQVGECEKYARPLVAFPAHWAPDDLVFYTATQFPAKYRGGAFIAFHGSWNRAPLPQGGYQVAFQPMANGKPTGQWETFIDGFAGQSPLMQPQEARHRPAGLALGPDGSLYISDDTAGRIWRILYRR